MSTFFMFGKYTSEAIKGMSAERTKRGNSLIEKYGGAVKSMYALLGEYDLVIIADFPNTKEAMKASVSLSQITGISFSTSPAVTVDRFDKMISEM
ncbi:GYD domain-containing protein [candidate division KSB1 bacterium]|nr:GYD domain-containing protein [candidate division KSB1 bacterium]